MKLSMWILADWLKKYHPQIKIQEGECVLRNARLFSCGLKLGTQDVYMGSMKEFACGENDRIICVQGHDMLLLDTDDKEEIFNELLDAFDYYSSWSDLLRKEVREGASLQRLLEMSEEVFREPLLVCDTGYYVTAQAGFETICAENPQMSLNLTEMRRNGVMPLKTILSICSDPRIRVNSRRAYVMDYESLGSPAVCRNLYSHNRHIGWVLIILGKDQQAAPAMLQILEELGDIVEYWSDYNIEQQELLSYNDIFQQILSDTETDQQKQLTRLRNIGWYPEDAKQIFVIQGKPNDTLLMEHFRRKLERLGSGCYTLTTQEGTALIINRRLIEYGEFCDKLKDFMEETETWCGISPEFTNVFQMREPISMASAAARLGPQEIASATNFADCALPYALEFLKRHLSSYIIHPVLAQLEKYDRENHTELYSTLRTFLNCERNYIQTAGQLFIHRNTLLYRLKRIRELTGVDLDDVSVRLHIQLSYLLAEIKDSTD